MNENDDAWNFDSVPQAFWQHIEDSAGSSKELEESLGAASEAELRELFDQNDGLGRSLLAEVFPQLTIELKEESNETLEEIADWLITQGRARYEEVLGDPEKFPSIDDVNRPILSAAILAVYTEKYGPWRS
ncbi:MAG: hypothetical protein DRJ42_13300 [Deltaproteobacteria bacterium]|nr:MAG: hypothetical protein DRJ42_13300 [Deltaproteobacteria bacterium]